MFNLLGRKLVVSAAFDHSSGVMPKAVVLISFKNWWFHEKSWIVDPISFLLIAEKAAEHKGGDFTYDQHHEEVHVCVTVPSWAIGEFTDKCGELAPKIYETIKRVSEEREELMKQAETLGVKTTDLPIKEDTPLARYKKLHAKINGYAMHAFIDTGDRTIN